MARKKQHSGPLSAGHQVWFDRAQLAAILGITLRQFERIVAPELGPAETRQVEGCAKLEHSAPAAVRVYARKMKPLDNADEERSERISAHRLKQEKLRLELDQKRGKVIERAEHEAILERECSARSEWFVGVLDRLAAEMPARLAGKSAPDVRDELLRTFAAVRLAGFGEQTA